MANLTPKQEGFCKSYIETGNASQAYRLNYDASGMNENSINRKAKELLDHGKIAARLDELREVIIVKHNITIESLLAELEEARQMAFATGKAAPAVAASMGKAKLVGLDRQIIDHTSTDGSMTPKPSVSINPLVVKELAKQLNESC